MLHCWWFGALATGSASTLLLESIGCVNISRSVGHAGLTLVSTLINAAAAHARAVTPDTLDLAVHRLWRFELWVPIHADVRTQLLRSHEGLWWCTAACRARPKQHSSSSSSSCWQAAAAWILLHQLCASCLHQQHSLRTCSWRKLFKDCIC